MQSCRGSIAYINSLSPFNTCCCCLETAVRNGQECVCEYFFSHQCNISKCVCRACSVSVSTCVNSLCSRSIRSVAAAEMKAMNYESRCVCVCVSLLLCFVLFMPLFSTPLPNRVQRDCEDEGLALFHSQQEVRPEFPVADLESFLRVPDLKQPFTCFTA